LDHTGVGKQQCRVVLGDERRTPYDFVLVLLEIVQKFFAYVIACHGLHSVWFEQTFLLAATSRMTTGGLFE
jgi:hypothetical protein